MDTTASGRLTAALNGEWRGGYGIARCPAHDDRDPSLSIRDGRTGVLLTCHAGCDRAAIIAALRARGLWGGARGMEEHPEHAPRPAAAPNRNREHALRIWSETQPAAGTAVDLWLRARGIRFAIPAAIRYHPVLPYRDAGRTLGTWPAMVVRMDDPAGRFLGVHRTWLSADFTPDPVGKATVRTQRMALGELGAAWLGPRDARAIIVAEGIETALAASELHNGSDDPPEPYGLTPVACFTAGGLARFEPPPTVKRVFVCEDADEAGRKATASLAETARRRGCSVTILHMRAANGS